LILDTADLVLCFIGFRFHSCFLEALQKADPQSISHPSDAAGGSLTSSEVKTDDTCAASEQEAVAACDETSDCSDSSLNFCDLFELPCEKLL